MATKTNLQLKNLLASLVGYEQASDLPAIEAEEIQTFVNQALFECYAPINGTRPNYGEQYFSDLLKAPVVATLTLTEGSKVVAGYAFEAKYAGSLVKIGDRAFRFGGISSGPVYHLVQPWDRASGTYEATIYHNAVALPGTLLEVAGQPEIIGLGLLGPLPDPDVEMLFRTEPAWDFTPRGVRSPFGGVRRRFNPAIFDDSGDPRYYHIDSASVGPTFTLGNRLHVYPLPSEQMTVSMRCSYMAAAPMTADGETPPMPFDAVDNILLPLAREALVVNWNGRRFTGDARLIIEAAKRARDHLRTLTRPQRMNAGRFALKPGW